MNRLAVFVTSVVVLAACSGEKKPTEDSNAGQPGASVPSFAGGTQTPDAGRKVITVEMTSDEKGNYFSPNEVEAKPGDVVRFTLKVGVHNVHFLPDSNPGTAGLPEASEMLQLPGQTYDLKVTGPFTPGHSYHFQSDPHALLGMQGKLEVEK
jgi:plastocyanin